MKLLFTQHNQGYSWSNDHSYYECTQEEYDDFMNSISRNKEVHTPKGDLF